MNNKLFVGNLPFSLSEDDLSELFSQYGEVVSCSMPTDRDTGRKRGFAFVEMKDQSQAEAAITGLNGRQVEGRALSVSVSQPKPSGGGGGGKRRY
jgi:RNA recognition motif-containing protein